jgi:hypothetical protein
MFDGTKFRIPRQNAQRPNADVIPLQENGILINAQLTELDQ